jgi:hypothetical protein
MNMKRAKVKSQSLRAALAVFCVPIWRQFKAPKSERTVVRDVITALEERAVRFMSSRITLFSQ